MKVRWTSRKGRRRKFNNDAAAVVCKNGFIVIAIADASEKPISGTNPEGQSLASYWVESCVKTISGTPEALIDSNKLIELLRTQQKLLRDYFLHDTASYGVLILNTSSSIGSWLFVGDCLLGSVDGRGQVSWLHKPHRASECSALELTTNEGCTLTKSLNAKRFAYPESLCLTNIEKSTALILATDGYWYEHLMQGVEMNCLEDDNSVLKIESGTLQLLSNTDARNLFWKVPSLSN